MQYDCHFIVECWLVFVMQKLLKEISRLIFDVIYLCFGRVSRMVEPRRRRLQRWRRFRQRQGRLWLKNNLSLLFGLNLTILTLSKSDHQNGYRSKSFKSSCWIEISLWRSKMSWRNFSAFCLYSPSVQWCGWASRDSSSAMWFLRLRAWPSEPESIFIMTLFWMGWCCESCVRGNRCSVNNVFVTELGSFVLAKSQLINR